MTVDIGQVSVPVGELFRVVWQGWFVGVTAIFFPILAVLSLTPSAGLSWGEYLLVILSIPIVAALQGLMAGVFVIFGLFVWPSQRPASNKPG